MALGLDRGRVALTEMGIKWVNKKFERYHVLTRDRKDKMKSSKKNVHKFYHVHDRDLWQPVEPGDLARSQLTGR